MHLNPLLLRISSLINLLRLLNPLYRWIRLICRALLMARIDDVLVRNRAFSTSPDSPTFSDFCWAWFEPTPEMRDAYL